MVTEHVNVNILYYQQIDCDSLSCLVVGKLGWKCKISHQKRTKGFSDFFQTLLCKKSLTSHSPKFMPSTKSRLTKQDGDKANCGNSAISCELLRVVLYSCLFTVDKSAKCDNLLITNSKCHMAVLCKSYTLEQGVMAFRVIHVLLIEKNSKTEINKKTEHFQSQVC